MPDLSVTGTDGNIYLTAPEYPASGFSGTGQWVISESSVVSGSPQVIASQIAPPSDAIMRNISGGNGLTYYVSAFSNGSQSELTYETYSAAAGFSGTQTLALGNNDQGSGGTDYTAQQAGTTLTLDAGDSHIQSLAYANGYLYGVSETMPVGASAPDVHWFKLDVSNPASPQIVAQGDLSGSLLGNANIALFNPSIAVDGNGDVLINFTASGPNMDPSDYYVVQGAKIWLLVRRRSIRRARAISSRRPAPRELNAGEPIRAPSPTPTIRTASGYLMSMSPTRASQSRAASAPGGTRRSRRSVSADRSAGDRSGLRRSRGHMRRPRQWTRRSIRSRA
jgi:hypothetical protein